MSVSLESIGGKLYIGGEEVALKSDLESLEARTKIVDFGTVGLSQRIVLPNPFFDGINDAEIATRCVVRAEVLYDGIWSEAGWYLYASNAGGNGAKGFSNLEGIVVQTGGISVLQISYFAGGGHGYSGSALSSAPCRVVVSLQSELIAPSSLIPKPEYIDSRSLATAWCNFDGTLTGTFAPRDGFNVESITKVANGSFDITFKEDMDNTNYSTSGLISDDAVGGGAVIESGVYSLRTVSTFRILTGANVNRTSVSVQVFGGKAI